MPMDMAPNEIHFLWRLRHNTEKLHPRDLFTWISLYVGQPSCWLCIRHGVGLWRRTKSLAHKIDA